MARRIDQIEKDLATLEESLGAIAKDLEKAYERYLEDLGTVASQQLILAAYHLCTQGYPEQFLALSASQREEAQQGLRSLTREATEDLRDVLYPKPSDPDPETAAEEAEPLTSAVVLDAQGTMHEEAAIATPTPAQEEENLPHLPSDLAPNFAPEPEAASPPAEELASEPDLSAATEVPESSTEEDEDDEGDRPLSVRSKSIADTEGTVIIQLNNPFNDDEDEDGALLVLPADPLDRIVKWQERIEASISKVLQTLSYGANRLLHRVEILPHHLPDPVLEVAIKSGMTSESAGSPNLMKLMIEAKSEESESSGVLQFVIIRLRLSELEFGNPNLSSQRSQIRQLLSRLSKVAKDYRRRQREKATAQAELAWRSTWHEG